MADNKLTKSIGEHWACAELARWGWSPALTRDGLERTDILAVATHLGSRVTVEVQVKTATENTGGVTTWLLGEKAQQSAHSEHEWFVLALAPRDHAKAVRGFIVPRDHVAAATWIIHQDWLHDPNVPAGKRNTPFARARVRESVFQRYEGRWDLLDGPTSGVPVLLPTWVRDRTTRAHVGLPPTPHPWSGGTPTSWQSD